MLEQYRKNLEGLALNFDSLASLPQLSGLQISLKETEKDPGRALDGARHGT
jgi:hypothetical protein